MPQPPAEPIRLTVPSGATGRLDAWLATQLPDRSRAEIQRWIRAGRVRAWDRAGSALASLTPKRPVASIARLEISPPPEREVVLAPEPIGLSVVHEDEALLVLDKPPGLVVHPSPGHEGGTLVNALLYRGGDWSTVGGADRPGLVHRLDRDTSGLIVVARTDRAHRALAAQFKARTVRKRYLAITEPAPRWEREEIDAPIGRSPRDRKKMAVVPGGRPARTRFRVLERFGRFALVRAAPETGRTHQIRVHLRAAGAPILCDAAYGRRAAIDEPTLLGRNPRGPRPAPLLARQALHAAELGFTHPETGAYVSFEAPLPADMAAVLAVLRAAGA